MEQKDKDYLLFWIALIVITMLLLIGKASAQTPTKIQVYNELKKQGAINPEVALKICILETGHITSRLAIEQNNLFGFLNSCGYMEFNKWQDCIEYFVKIERKRWDKYHKKGDYYDFIAWWGYNTGKSYSEKDFKYVEYLKKIEVK